MIAVARLGEAFRPLFLGIGSRPVLLLAVLLPLAIARQVLGDSFGASGLFWHYDSPLLQALSGIGATLLLGQICFVAYLLDSHRPGKYGRDARRHLGLIAPRQDPIVGGVARLVSPVVQWISRQLVFVMRFVVPAPWPNPAPGGTLGRLIAGAQTSPFLHGTAADGPIHECSWHKLRRYLARTWLPLLVPLVWWCVAYVTSDWPWTGRDNDNYSDDQHFGMLYQGEEGMWVFGLSPAGCLVIAITRRWAMLLGIATGLVVGRLFLEAFLAISRWFTPWLIKILPRWAPAVPQLWLHMAVAVVFLGIFGLAWSWPTADQCALLAVWLFVHGGVIALFGLAANVPPGEMWKHVLAGLAFSSAFILYQLLFLLYRQDRGGGPARLISPALVMCLFLALVVTVHGFLRFHFRVTYVVVGLGLVAGAVVLNSLVGYKNQLPGLEATIEHAPLALQDADGPALIETYHEAVKLLHDLRQARKDRGDSINPSIIAAAEDQVADAAKRLRGCYRRFYERYESQTATFKSAGVLVKSSPPPPSEVVPADADLAQEITDLRDRLLNLEAHRLATWKVQAAPKGHKPRLAVVAVSGGALRSAVWTTFVLDKLEQDLPDFPRHVRVISGASGGMLGATYFAATLRGPAGHDVKRNHEDFVLAIAPDDLTPVMQHLLFVDVPATIIPRTPDSDRGLALEEAWRKYTPVLAQPLSNIADAEVEGWRPSLIFAPMLIEDGRRLLISNLYLPTLTESSGNLLSDQHDVAVAGTAIPGNAFDRPKGLIAVPKGKRPDDDSRSRYSLSAIELFNLFPQARGRLRLSTAARMNATFPYISPPGELPTVPRRRTVDAGYFDNYGVNVTAAWLYDNRKWIAEHTSGVVLIQIRDQVSARRQLYAGDDGWSLGRGIEWLTGPLAGAGSALESTQAFRDDQRVQGLDDYFTPIGGKEFFTTVVFESRADISLDWFLTAAEKRHLLKGFDPYMDERGDRIESANQRALKKLQVWWGPGHD